MEIKRNERRVEANLKSQSIRNESRGIVITENLQERPREESEKHLGKQIAMEQTTEQGIKRKMTEEMEGETSNAAKRIVIEQPQLESDQGLVVLHKPPPAP